MAESIEKSDGYINVFEEFEAKIAEAKYPSNMGKYDKCSAGEWKVE